MNVCVCVVCMVVVLIMRMIIIACLAYSREDIMLSVVVHVYHLVDWTFARCFILPIDIAVTFV